MVPAANLLAFALAALLLIAVPGPSVLFVVGRTLALGRRGGLLSVLGNAVGRAAADRRGGAGRGSGAGPVRRALQRGQVRRRGLPHLPRDPGHPAPRRRPDGGGPHASGVDSPGSFGRDSSWVPPTPSRLSSLWPCCRSLWTIRPAPFRSSWRRWGRCSSLIALVSDSGWALIAGTAPALVCQLAPADRRPGHHRRSDDDRAGRNPCPRRERGGAPRPASSRRRRAKWSPAWPG